MSFNLPLRAAFAFSTASAGVSNTAYHPCIGRFPKKLKLCLQDRGGMVATNRQSDRMILKGWQTEAWGAR